MARKFAVFDIDGTIIRWQLYHAVASELAKLGFLRPDAYQRIEQARMAWKRRDSSESFREYEQVLVKVYFEALASLNIADYLNVVDSVFNRHKDQVYTYTRDLMRSLKAEGYLLFAISGSQYEIVSKLAEYYGFDDFAGTVFEEQDGHFIGEKVNVIHNKAAILQAMVSKHGASFAGSIGVGDSEGDRALLELVERPIAFNPSAKLLDTAKERSWEIVVERKNVIYNLKASNGSYLLA